MLEIARGNISKRLFARRRVPEHLRLLDAQQFGGENLFRPRDIGCVDLRFRRHCAGNWQRGYLCRAYRNVDGQSDRHALLPGAR